MWAVFRFHRFPWYIIDFIHAKTSIQRIKNSNSALQKQEFSASKARTQRFKSKNSVLQKQELSTSKTGIQHFKNSNLAHLFHFFITYCTISLCS